MSKEVIKPLELPEMIDSAEMVSLNKDHRGKLEIIFDIVTPGTFRVKMVFSSVAVLHTAWLDIAAKEFDEENMTDTSSGAIFTVIENSEWLTNLVADRQLGLNSEFRHYRLWFRDDGVEFLARGEFEWEILNI